MVSNFQALESTKTVPDLPQKMPPCILMIDLNTLGRFQVESEEMGKKFSMG